MVLPAFVVIMLAGGPFIASLPLLMTVMADAAAMPPSAALLAILVAGAPFIALLPFLAARMAEMAATGVIIDAGQHSASVSDAWRLTDAQRRSGSSPSAQSAQDQRSEENTYHFSHIIVSS
jgi:hypothetical protein